MAWLRFGAEHMPITSQDDDRIIHERDEID